MTTILTNDFKTPVGVVQTFLQSDKSDHVITSGNNTITTFGHEIKLEIFELVNDWIPDTMRFDTSICWRWFITKINDKEEHLKIYCKLNDSTPETTWGYDSGEHLDAIEIENKTHQLHIGTEDTDAHLGRSVQNDWMPKRFENKLGLHRSTIWTMTKYIDFGFETTVPDLMNKERIYFHFLVASNKIKPSYRYPNERDCSTWYAVEQSKKFLDEYLKMKNTAANKTYKQ